MEKKDMEGGKARDCEPRYNRLYSRKTYRKGANMFKQYKGKRIKVVIGQFVTSQASNSHSIDYL